MKRALLKKITAVFLLILIVASALPMYAAADGDAPGGEAAVAVAASNTDPDPAAGTPEPAPGEAATPSPIPETPKESEKPTEPETPKESEKPTEPETPDVSPKPGEKPAVIVRAAAQTKPLEAKEELELLLSIQNLGKVKLSSVSVMFTPSAALTLPGLIAPVTLGDIDAGQTQTFKLKLKVADKIDKGEQTLTVELKYGYSDGSSLLQDGVSEVLKIAVNPTETSAPATPVEEPVSFGGGFGGGGSGPDSPVPHIIITEFEYGGESVVAGKKFSLGFSFENAGKLKIENIVMTVDGGESFAMDGSTNTFYYSALSSGAKQNQKLPLQTLATAKTGAQSVGIGFKYEYLDGSKRASATADIKISMPVYQPDRFQINAPIVPDTVNSGEELAISLSYVNKGKSDISNVEATVEGEGVDTPAKTQYLGNITPGSSGNIGFALTPNRTGTVKLKLTVSYEGTDMQVQTKSFPVTLTVAEGVPDDMLPEPQPESPAGGVIAWIAAIGLIGGGGGAGFYFLRKRKKIFKAMTEPVADWSAWDDDSDSPPDTSEGEQT